MTLLFLKLMALAMPQTRVCRELIILSAVAVVSIHIQLQMLTVVFSSIVCCTPSNICCLASRLKRGKAADNNLQQHATVCRSNKAPQGYTLAAFSWFIDQTMGGAVATATHGSSFRYGSLSNQVLNMLCAEQSRSCFSTKASFSCCQQVFQGTHKCT